jgi:hypothetical protein
MTRVKCKSGIDGWQEYLQTVFLTFGEFKANCDLYGLHRRMGYKTIWDAWADNPLVEGSINPSDFRRVKKKPKPAVVIIRNTRMHTWKSVTLKHWQKKRINIGGTYYRIIAARLDRDLNFTNWIARNKHETVYIKDPNYWP